MEYIWKGSTSLDGNESYIFVHLLGEGYGSPSYLRFWQGKDWISTEL